jgi:hypothetical protein
MRGATNDLGDARTTAPTSLGQLYGHPGFSPSTYAGSSQHFSDTFGPSYAGSQQHFADDFAPYAGSAQHFADSFGAHFAPSEAPYAGSAQHFADDFGANFAPSAAAAATGSRGSSSGSRGSSGGWTSNSQQMAIGSAAALANANPGLAQAILDNNPQQVEALATTFKIPRLVAAMLLLMQGSNKKAA